jgi:hypothetical protein
LLCQFLYQLYHQRCSKMRSEVLRWLCFYAWCVTCR